MPLRTRISDEDLRFVGLSRKRIDALRDLDDEIRQDVYEWEMRDLMSAPSGR